MNLNHICTLIPVEYEEIDYTFQWYEKHKSSLVLNASYDIESPIYNNSNNSIKQKTIDFHLTKVGEVVDDNKLMKEKNKYTSLKAKIKSKEQKQHILSTWIIAGTDEEHLKLIKMQ